MRNERESEDIQQGFSSHDDDDDNNNNINNYNNNLTQYTDNHGIYDKLLKTEKIQMRSFNLENISNSFIKAFF